jgi:hypothetical protein
MADRNRKMLETIGNLVDSEEKINVR